MSAGLSHTAIRAAFGAQPLFEDKTWQLSPEPWLLTSDQVAEIEAIGTACWEFYQACELLYTRSRDQRPLLRNGPLTAPWVAGWLDRGKPQRLLKHAAHRRLRRRMPVVIRPDLLLTHDGFALTEMDSVPGGIGLTAFLNRLYAPTGRAIIGGEDRMLMAFYQSLAALRADKPLPLIVIAVSDEASTYRPEMEWLAGELQQLGLRVHCLHPNDIFPLGEAICADINGNPEEIDVIYRFWELFDLPHIPIAEAIMDAIEGGNPLVVTPPMRPFQEEKMSLALFHHHLLEAFWRENLSKASHRLLQRIIPRSWVLDPVELPPSAVLDAPWLGGRPIHNWRQLAQASQKERQLILKISGFHETAWGARSVLLGSDASREEWEDGIREAIEGAATNPYIVQDYRKPERSSHPLFAADGQLLAASQGRVRLCPYYFASGEQVTLGGILATFCPADKKIIHGMRDAAMLPCAVG
jgi:hypothetical protein